MPNCKHPFGISTLSFWFRIGKSEKAFESVGRGHGFCFLGKVWLLDGSTYPSGRVVTHSSDVTSESKIDTNAGTTAAAGFGYSVLGFGRPSVSNGDVKVSREIGNDQREWILATVR